MRQKCRLFLDESLMRRFYLTVSLIKHIFKTYSLFLIKLHTSRPTRLAGSLRADRRGGPKSRREPQVYMYHRTIFEHLLLRNSVSHKLPLSSSKLLLNLLRETLDNIWGLLKFLSAVTLFGAWPCARPSERRPTRPSTEDTRGSRDY